MIWSALLLGLAGSLHCAVMCGPIVLSLIPGSNAGGILKSLLYHSGRIISYVFIGLFFGLAGKALHLVVYQQYISIISGVLILIILMFKLFPSTFRKFGFVYPAWLKLKESFLPIAKSGNAVTRSLIFGGLNGLLPCGLVYIAASASLSSGSISNCMIYMIMFGLGTLPMMFGISFSGSLFKTRFGLRFNRLMPVAVILISVLFIVRGLGLNIPYLSPKISSQGDRIESCCKHCHNDMK